MAGPETVVTQQHLAALDEARDYDAASSYNYLNAELRKLRGAIRLGGLVCIEGEAGRVLLSSDSEFVAWAYRRYPYADLA